MQLQFVILTIYSLFCYFMEIFNKILHSYAMYCRKEMVKILKCYLIPKKSYDTLSKGAIFFVQPCNYNFYIYAGQSHFKRSQSDVLQTSRC